MAAIVVLTTVGDEATGLMLARELVGRRLAACVNLVPGVRSIYRWKGEVSDEGELLLVIKTLDGKLAAVREAIRELHPYELPEVLALDVAFGEARYLEWIAAAVDDG